MTETRPVVDTAAKTVTHGGLTFAIRPYGTDAFNALIDGEPVGRLVYTFGAAMAVVESPKVTEEVLTQVAEAWFAAIES